MNSTLNKRILSRGWSGAAGSLVRRPRKAATSTPSNEAPRLLLVRQTFDHCCCASSLTSACSPEGTAQRPTGASDDHGRHNAIDRSGSLPTFLPSGGGAEHHAPTTAVARTSPDEAPRRPPIATSQSSQQHQLPSHRWRHNSAALRAMGNQNAHSRKWNGTRRGVPASRGKFRNPDEGKRFVREVKRLGEAGDWREAISLLRAAEKDGRAVNQIMYNATIAALSRSGRWQEAMSILRSMEANGVERDVRGFAAAMVACREAGEWERAVGLLEEMKAEGIAPNFPTFCVALSACSRKGQWRRALSLLEVDMASAGVEPNLKAWQIVLDACVVAGRGEEAAAYLPRMRAAGVEPNVSCYERVIYATAKKGNWELALQMLEDMGDAGLSPSGRSFAAAMKTCVEVGRKQKRVTSHLFFYILVVVSRPDCAQA